MFPTLNSRWMHEMRGRDPHIERTGAVGARHTIGADGGPRRRGLPRSGDHAHDPLRGEALPQRAPRRALLVRHLAGRVRKEAHDPRWHGTDSALCPLAEAWWPSNRVPPPP